MLHYYWVHFYKIFNSPKQSIFKPVQSLTIFYFAWRNLSFPLLDASSIWHTNTHGKTKLCLEIIAGDDITHHQHKLKRRQLASGRRRRPWLDDKLALTQVVPSKAVRSGIMNIYSSSQMSIDCVMGTQFRGIMTGLRVERLRRSALFIPEMKINK